MPAKTLTEATQEKELPEEEGKCQWHQGELRAYPSARLRAQHPSSPRFYLQLVGLLRRLQLLRLNRAVLVVFPLLRLGFQLRPSGRGELGTGAQSPATAFRSLLVTVVGCRGRGAQGCTGSLSVHHVRIKQGLARLGRCVGAQGDCLVLLALHLALHCRHAIRHTGLGSLSGSRTAALWVGWELGELLWRGGRQPMSCWGSGNIQGHTGIFLQISTI